MTLWLHTRFLSGQKEAQDKHSAGCATGIRTLWQATKMCHLRASLRVNLECVSFGSPLDACYDTKWREWWPPPLHPPHQVKLQSWMFCFFHLLGSGMHETTFFLFKIAAPPSAPAPAAPSRIPADPGGMLMLGTALNSFSISSSVRLALLARAAMLAHWWLRFVHKGSASKFWQIYSARREQNDGSWLSRNGSAFVNTKPISSFFFRESKHGKVYEPSRTAFTHQTNPTFRRVRQFPFFLALYYCLLTFWCNTGSPIAKIFWQKVPVGPAIRYDGRKWVFKQFRHFMAVFDSIFIKLSFKINSSPPGGTLDLFGLILICWNSNFVKNI